MQKKKIIILIAIICFFLAGQSQLLAAQVSYFADQLSNQIIANASNHEIKFNLGADFGPDKTLEIYFEPDFDLSLIDYNDIDFLDDAVNVSLASLPGSGTGSDMGVAVSGQTITFTQNDTDTISVNSEITILIGLNAESQTIGDQQIYNPEIAGIYKITISGTSNNTGQISVAILNSDSIFLQGEIVPELTLILRNPTDTGAFSNCAFGTIILGEISMCSYRIAAKTNAERGFQVFVKTDGNFRSSESYIANIDENNQVQAGVEGYGIALNSGTGIIEVGDYNDDDSQISTGDALLIKTNSSYNYIQGSLSTSSLVTHKVAISETTSPGQYSQAILYTILANY
ncbi:hypothetical protein JW977_00450 [Candidatus Falkowbacteria bacterium]|nr:hypothetical protein [Candidatus Falkowbacteria bacterium]